MLEEAIGDGLIRSAPSGGPILRRSGRETTMRVASWMLLSLSAATAVSCASRPEATGDPFTELERTDTTSLLRLTDRGRPVAESSMVLVCHSAEFSLDRGFDFFRVVSPEEDPALERDQVRLEFFEEIPPGFQAMPSDAAADPAGMDVNRIVIDASAILDMGICGRL
jgi:hypothetical protein